MQALLPHKLTQNTALVPEAVPMNEPEPDHILQVGMGFLASKTLLSAIEMELFTELADRSEPMEMLQGRPAIFSIHSWP
jgi:hypothetical protein